MVKRALLVGVNYPGTTAELHGCHNDVVNMYNCLINRYGFPEENMVVLADAGFYTRPTGANIRRELNNLVSSAEPGDCLYFYYSGHGSRMPAETGDEDDTGYDECIIPSDFNPITDQDFKELVMKVPDGCKITIVSDSCHSGGLLEGAKEQIGNSSGPNRIDVVPEPDPEGINESASGGVEGEPEVEQQDNEGNRVKARYLPLSSLINNLKEKSGRDVNVGNIRLTLCDLFGEDASPKFKKFLNVIIKRHEEGRLDGDRIEHGHVIRFLRGLSHKILSRKDEEEDEDVEVENEAEVYAGSNTTFPNNGVMISGCQSYQFSLELPTPEGEHGGACTNAILQVIEETEGQVTNRDLVWRVREKLAEQQHPQRPGLYCSDEHLDTPFIC